MTRVKYTQKKLGVLKYTFHEIRNKMSGPLTPNFSNLLSGF